jgi:predicted nuclease with TOPRIM domain
MPDAPKRARTSEVFREPLQALTSKIDEAASETSRHLANSLSSSDVEGALKALTELKAIKEVEDSFEAIQQKHKEGDEISKNISEREEEISQKGEEISKKRQEIEKMEEELDVLRQSKETLEEEKETKESQQKEAAQKYIDAIPKPEEPVVDCERLILALEAHYVDMVPFGATEVTKQIHNVHGTPISTEVSIQQLVLERVGRII